MSAKIYTVLFVLSAASVRRGTGARPRPWISQGERHYSGPDRALEAELARRLAARAQAVPLVSPDEERAAARDLRRALGLHGPRIANNTRRQTYKGDPKHREFTYMMHRMELQHIYATQYRMKEASDATDKHTSQPQFRIGYIMLKLDDWIMELRMSYTFARQVHDFNKFTVNRYIIYYTHCLRKYLDIVYTIDHLLDLHAQVLVQMESLDKKPGKKPGKQRRPRPG